MDIIEKLAQNVMDTKYERLPREAIEAARKAILDTLAVAVAGASDCEKEVAVVRDLGEKEESSVLVYGGKVPVANAAWVNTIMASALDYDDAFEGGLHVSCCAIPTALAVSEAVGGIDGKELLTAIAAGTDLAVRIHRASRSHGFSTTGTTVIFGTTAIAARLMGLSLEGMLNAFGLALARAAGTYQANIDKVAALRAIRGFSSRSGIECAMMAQRGITGVKGVLQGTYGFFHLFSRDDGNLNILTEQLGEKYQGVMLFNKKYPSCGTTLPSTEAALRIAQEFDLDAKEIREITVEVSKFVNSITGQPFKVGSNPRVDAQFSQAYCVANAFLRKSGVPLYYTEKYIRDPQIAKLAKKVHIVITKGQDAGEDNRINTTNTSADLGSTVRVEMKNGEKYSKSVGFEEIARALSAEEVRQKFMDCAACAPGSSAEKNSQKIIQTIDELEKVRDVSRLVKLLVPGCKES